MKICHISQYCHANTTGGTERYILELIRGLEALGWGNVFGSLETTDAAPRIVDGVLIHSLPTPPMRIDTPMSGLAAAVHNLFEDQKPDIIHFHTFGLSEAFIATAARARRIPIVFTYHSPAWTCRRETLLFRGINPCDGEVKAARCSACQAEERLGLGPSAAWAATAASMLAGWIAMPMGRTPLRRRTAFYWDTKRFRAALREFLRSCDGVISCAHWSTPVLLSNGTRPETLHHIPQGVSPDFTQVRETVKDIPTRAPEFTIGYLGRQTPVKGLHLLMEAFAQVKYPAARLRIVGWEPENAHTAYGQQLLTLVQKDDRITLVPKTKLNETVCEYQKLSLLAIPSVWMETGPLTLFEALSLGIPVYGSERVGQIELLRRFGRVVQPNTAAGWREALEAACDLHQTGQWEKLIQKTRVNAELRSMKEVADEMNSLYRTLPLATRDPSARLHPVAEPRS